MELSVICGTNKQLQRKLEKMYGRNEKIHIVGYTSQMSLYMDSADLFLTKPGGISITESAVKKLPMAFVDAVAGCEQYNMNFFVKMGAAVTSDSTKELAEQSIRILKSDAQRKKMEDALRNYQYLGGAEIVFRELEKEQEGAEQHFFSDIGSKEIYEARQYSRLQDIQVS